jgi:branched-chain amino acid transport system ATP-binding protein
MTTLSDAAVSFTRAAEGEVLPAVRPHNPGRASATEAGAATLALQGVSLSFGGVAALRDVDLAFADGRITAVIGPNGAGKTSLINVISGAYAPDKGRIFIKGRAYKRSPTNRLASLGVARTFQNLGLFKGLSTFDNIATGLSFATRSTIFEQVLGIGRSPQEDLESRRRTEEAIALLRLEPFRDRLVGGLPYGVQKRIELARAVVAAPHFLLLDEPLAGMTLEDKAEMSDFIRSVQRRLSATIVLIEHDIGVVMSLSDHVAVFDYGRKIAEGTTTEVQADQAVIDAYLGVPHAGEEA